MATNSNFVYKKVDYGILVSYSIWSGYNWNIGRSVQQRSFDRLIGVMMNLIVIPLDVFKYFTLCAIEYQISTRSHNYQPLCLMQRCKIKSYQCLNSGIINKEQGCQFISTKMQKTKKVIFFDDFISMS